MVVFQSPSEFVSKIFDATKSVLSEIEDGATADLEFLEVLVLRVWAWVYMDIREFSNAELVAKSIKDLWSCKVR